MACAATVLKLGGELLEDAAAIRASAAAIVRLAGREPLVVVHGGGRAIDAELKVRGVTPRFADGLRVTDSADARQRGRRAGGAHQHRARRRDRRARRAGRSA